MTGAWKHQAFLISLICVWYLFSYQFNSGLKEWFRMTEDHACTLFPLLLAIFLSNAVAAGIWALHGAGCLTSPRAAVSDFIWVTQVLTGSLKVDSALVCASGAVGITASCIVLQYGSIQLVQVARSVGPLFTALWAYLVLDQRTTGAPLACLGITLAGTALASWQEPTFSTLTLCLMLTINTTLTFRNAVTKRIIQVFQAISSPVLPGPSKDPRDHNNGTSGPIPPSVRAPPSSTAAGLASPTAMSCLLLTLTNLVGLLAVVGLWAAQAFCSSWGGTHSRRIADAVMLPSGAGSLLLMLGLCNLMYNVASQVVLAHVAVVSHGMLELFKRVFVLLAASALIGDVEWRWHNAAGAALATIGTVLYFRTMSEHPASHRKGGGTSATASASGIQSKKHSPRDGATGGGGGSSASGLRLHVAYILMTLVLVVSPVEFLGDGFSFARGGATPTSVIGNGAARRTPGDGNVLSYAPLEMFGMDVDPPQASAYLPSSDAAGMPTPVLVGGILGLKDMLPFHRNLPRAPVSGGACGGGGSVGRETLGRADGGGPEADGSRRRIAQDGASSASSSSPRGLAGVYTGWLDKQNMGDDIVADIFLDVLAAAVIRATDGRTCVTLERLSPGLAAAGLPGGCTLKNSAGCDFGVLGGGSLVYIDYLKRISGVLMAGRPVLVFGTGFQSGLAKKRLSERYLRMLCKGKLLGGVRGPETKAYLQQFGCGDSVRVIRDSALLAGLIYGGGRTALRPQLQEQILEGRHIAVATLKGSASLPVFNSTLHALLKTGRFAMVLQAVDEEGARLHRHWAEFFSSTRPPGTPPVLFHDEFQDWAAILDLYRHASVSINSRLHSGVLSLASRRPTLYLANNVKYRDLMGSINLTSLMIDPEMHEHLAAGPDLFGAHVASLMAATVREASALGERIRLVQQETMRDYETAVADLLSLLESRNPEAYRSTLCCGRIRISRSTGVADGPTRHKMLIHIQCERPRGRGEGGGDGKEECPREGVQGRK